MSEYKTMSYSKFSKLQKKASLVGLSDFAEFAKSCSGNEFYDRRTNQKVYLWQISNTFTPSQIASIKLDRNGLYGYREKEMEESV